MRALVFSVLSACAVLSACTPGAGPKATSGDDGFTCAALIGSATQLMANGKLAAAPDFQTDSLLASMAYLNAWAIPAGLSEAEAFSQVKAERDRLIETSSPNDIRRRAQACLDRAPDVAKSTD